MSRKGHAEELLGQTLESLRADLAAALRESAEVIAQRDTALGLCGQREREIATVTAERDQAREGWKTTSALAVETQDALDAERADLAETRKALEKAEHDLSWERGTHQEELESTRAELAKAEARVKELEASCSCGRWRDV